MKLFKRLPKGLQRRINRFRRLSVKKQIFIISSITLATLVVIAAATAIYFAATLSSKERIMNRNNTGLTLLDRNGKVFYEFYNAHSETRVSLEHINDFAEKAAISSEDKNFYKHAGFSPIGIATAVYENIRPGGLNSGGSTITQQLVKNALLSNERSFLRKYQELVLSIEIERRYSKAEILDMYLNSVYFGEGAFGIEDAAKAYFNKTSKDLTLAEASLLIGLLPAPAVYSPISGDPALAKKRQVYVLDRMVEDGHITAADAEAAKAQVLTYAPPAAQEKLQAPHFALMVKDELEKKYGQEKIARSGYKVKTTLDLSLQEKAEAAVVKQVNRLISSKVSNGGAVAIDPATGEILAMVGSKDWTEGTFGKVNMATATRQPGSSIKPIVYATGIEEKILTAATVFDDKLTDFGNYKPRNYDGRFRGEVTLRRALANSLNVPAVSALQQVGIEDMISQAKKLGITTLTETPETYGLPLALGSGQARLTEMTNAYATFANQGKHTELQSVLSINNKDGKEIFSSKPKTTIAISDDTAYVISSILSDNSARAETFGSSLNLSSGRTAAVKTGTTEDYRDAWAIGYTPSLAVGVWIGNNDNSPMSSIAGSSGAAPIWRQIMQDALSGKPSQSFPRPSSVIVQSICRGSYALAENDGDNTYTEYFLPGTLPTKRCNTNEEKQRAEEEKRRQEEEKRAAEERARQEEEEKKKQQEQEEEEDGDSTSPATPTIPTTPTTPVVPPTTD